MDSADNKKKEAKAYRKVTSRSDLGAWEVKTNRSVVEELISMQESTRHKNLIPIRHERMSASPFTFFRGAAIIQAHDLAASPGTPFRVQACGDAHISNFGIFASPERRVVFDINDFDETLPAPFEVDIKRLVASIEICGRNRGFSKEDREEAVFQAAKFYHHSMTDFSGMGTIEVWYKHLDLESFMENDPHFSDEKQLKLMRSAIDKALAKNSERALRKLTETVDGKIRIKSNPPLIVPIRDMIDEERTLYSFNHSIDKALAAYEKTLPSERRTLIDHYEPIELAHKVVGVGSVGLQAWMMIMLGRTKGDPLVMQIKQAEKSVLESYFGKSRYKNNGQRVVEGQRAIQTAGDILLGWLSLDNSDGVRRDYYVRQLWDAKGSFDLDTITVDGYKGLSSMCAWTLAHAHAKTGDRHAIAGYLGKGDAFESSMVRYAQAYADQNEADYEMFLKYCRKAES